MRPVARNVTMAGWGFLKGRRYVIMDRDSKYTAAFRAVLASAGLEVIRLPPSSPDLLTFSCRNRSSGVLPLLDGAAAQRRTFNWRGEGQQLAF